MTYTANDLTVMDDPLEYIRCSPQRFLRVVNGAELTAAVVAGACLLTDQPVTALRRGPWWIVGSEGDWMQLQHDESVNDLFTRIVPFPQAGRNSMHGEVLVAAFATDIVTANQDGVQTIKGAAPDNQVVREWLMVNPLWNRVLAFRIASAPGPPGT
jgi:hypothetical protein